jgi:hypothetical protein
MGSRIEFGSHKTASPFAIPFSLAVWPEQKEAGQGSPLCVPVIDSQYLSES